MNLVLLESVFPTLSNLLDLYQKAASGAPNNLTKKLWGEIPNQFQNVIKLISEKEINGEKENVTELLRKIAEKHHRNLGTYTSEVKEAINLLPTNGILEASHQPLLLGGSVFLPNKVAHTVYIARLTNLSPMFFVGDYDTIHNELIITRFPQATSWSGLFLKVEGADSFSGAPIHALPIPSENWMKNSLNQIKEAYRVLLKTSGVKGLNRILLEERLETYLQIIRKTAFDSSSVSEWTVKLWSNLFNVWNEQPIFFIRQSDPELRKILLEGFERLLCEENRKKFVKKLNEVAELLQTQNITPGGPHRFNNYVPFFLECLNCEQKTRVELVANNGTISGKCESCEEEFSFSYNPKKPDLSEIATSISPRVDSRTAVVCNCLPIHAHVSGAGETKYHAQVIPAMRSLEIPQPIMIRGTRVFYNTPWSETCGNGLREMGIDVVHHPSAFKLLGRLSKSKETEEILEICVDTSNLFNTSLNSLKSLVENLEESLKGNPGNQDARAKLKAIKLCLSHSFGHYDEKKSIQEVSWNWLDLGILNRPGDLCGAFLRAIGKPTMPPGQTIFISTGKFN